MASKTTRLGSERKQVGRCTPSKICVLEMGTRFRRHLRESHPQGKCTRNQSRMESNCTKEKRMEEARKLFPDPFLTPSLGRNVVVRWARCTICSPSVEYVSIVFFLSCSCLWDSRTDGLEHSCFPFSCAAIFCQSFVCFHDTILLGYLLDLVKFNAGSCADYPQGLVLCVLFELPGPCAF